MKHHEAHRSVRTRSDELRERAHAVIPGGAHTYSKGDDQFPAQAPAFLVRGSGSRVWDLEGGEYLDWGMGLRSVILGHGYPRVVEAVAAQLPHGSNMTRPNPLEVELAERLIGLIPCAEMVKFAKNGSDVTTAAVKLARAFTGRDKVAVCSDHAFFSFDDWFIGTTPMNSGVPKAIRDLSLTFRYNDLAGLRALFDEHAGQIACVILEPATTEAPRKGFLEAVATVARVNGALLIFDEMITGFRWDARGAQQYYGVTPDLATFGKAIGNGFAVAALVGRRDVMELGGIRHQRPRVFLLSATHGAELHSLVAARETIAEICERDVVAHIWRIGETLQRGLNGLAREFGIEGAVQVIGYPCSPALVFRDAGGEVSPAFRTLFLQETVARGVLIPYIAVSYSHGSEEVAQTLEACRSAFKVYADALAAGSAERFLESSSVRPVFRAFN